MRILVACEFSGTVRDAFIAAGHNAVSCDIEPCDKPGPHIQDDVLNVIKFPNTWDMMIAHPPCTYLTVTGNKWFKPEYKDRFPTREQDRKDAIAFFMALMNANIPKIAVENPIGIMSTTFRKPDQIIQPWQHGYPATKGTCLWLKNLPLLTPTNIVDKGEVIVSKSGKRMSRWYYDTGMIPLKNGARAKARNKTFQGIADAMAQQWGETK